MVKAKSDIEVVTPDEKQETAKVFEELDEKIKDATKTKEITNRIDEIIVDYLDLMYETIERECIYSVYKAVLKHITSNMEEDVPYRTAARIASTFTSDMLAELAEKDHIADIDSDFDDYED
jgi:hypothetical protein